MRALGLPLLPRPAGLVQAGGGLVVGAPEGLELALGAAERRLPPLVRGPPARQLERQIAALFGQGGDVGLLGLGPRAQIGRPGDPLLDGPRQPSTPLVELE
jgi:hypothetical protein